MIKAINISALNISTKLLYKCDHCKKEGTFVLENTVIHTDNNGNPVEPLDYECPGCGTKL